MKYAETCRQKEMSDWKNRYTSLKISTNFIFRRKLISTAKATQYRHGVWTPNMHVQEEFTNRLIETAYLKEKDCSKLTDKPLQGKSFYSGIPQRFVD